MTTQYIRIAKNVITPNKKVKVTRQQVIGVAVAKEVDGKLHFGWSMINPNDVKAIKEENREIRKRIGELKAEAGLVGKEVGELPTVKPEFNKMEAIEVAQRRLAEKINLDTVPRKIRRGVRVFIHNVSGSHYGKLHIV